MDEKYMKMAYENAMIAYKNGDVPVGAVIVMNNKVIASTYNRKYVDKNSLSHAELLAIKQATTILDDWRLNKCSIYVTLEPCPMCAAAIVQSRINRVIYAAGSNTVSNREIVDKIFGDNIIVDNGIYEVECGKLLKDFFDSIR